MYFSVKKWEANVTVSSGVLVGATMYSILMTHDCGLIKMDST